MLEIKIDQKLCKGCDLCLDLCPKKVFKETEEISPLGFRLKQVAFPENCVKCGLCELYCPGAISFDESTAGPPPREARLAFDQVRGGWKEMSSFLKPGKYFLTGNDAVVEGALAAGCRFFAGYPITPANEILEKMARRMREINGRFIQAEDEIAASIMILGASWAGLKTMTATSGPGFALMQESLSLADMAEIPCVVVNIQRAGPSTGQPTRPAAMDMREVRYGSHGGIQRIVLYPDSVQELYNLTIRAFDLAERFRVPVILLSDAYLAHLSESIIVEKSIKIFDRIYVPGAPHFGPTADFSAASMPRFGDGENLSITGSTHNEWGVRSTADPKIQENLIFHLQNKILKHRQKLIDVEGLFLEDAETVLVVFGTVGRSAKWAVKEARKKGKKVGLLRPRIVYPFPQKIIWDLTKRVEKIIVPEMNQGQMFFVVREGIPGDMVVSLPQSDGQIIDPRRILKYLIEEVW